MDFEIGRLGRERGALRDRLERLQQISAYASFSELDWRSIALEMECEGEAELFFVPIRPGEYAWRCRGLEGKGMAGGPCRQCVAPQPQAQARDCDGRVAQWRIEIL